MRLVPYAIPPALCAVLYWWGFNAWFRQDDFAWLMLIKQVHSPADLFRAVFEPMAQGTIRPISERAFFMGFRWLFDLNVAPYHALVFITQCMNLILLNAIVRRLSGSALAGTLAAIVWCSNSILFWPLTWCSAYNQILCAFSMLTAFFFLIRYAETGEPRYNRYQCIAFLLGFGVLELNVVYPAIAIAYTLLFNRKYTLKTLWLLIPSAAFTAIHNHFAPKAASGVYALKADFTIVTTLWTYWSRAIWPNPEIAPTLTAAGIAAMTLIFAATAIWAIARRDRLTAFAMAWFLITLAPYLLLPNHVSGYYLTVPAIGLAIALAHAAASRFAIAAIALLLMPFSWAASWTACKRAYAESREVETLVLALRQVNKAMPGKAILLSGVSDSLFWNAIYDRAPRAAGVLDVYISPDNVASLQPFPDLCDFADYSVPVQGAMVMLRQSNAVAFRYQPGKLVNNTKAATVRLATMAKNAAPPTKIEIGKPAFASFLGDTWAAPEISHRWMPKSATVRVGGTRNAAAKLHVRGFCAPEQLAHGPVHVTISVPDKTYPPAEVASCEGSFAFDYALPAEAIGKRELEVTIEVDRVLSTGADSRPLGMAIEEVSVR